MIISDLNYLENIFEGPGVVGGYFGGGFMESSSIYFPLSLSPELLQKIEKQIETEESAILQEANTDVALVVADAQNYAFTAISREENFISSVGRISLSA